MPERAQEPLTPIDLELTANFAPAPDAPPGTPTITFTVRQTMAYSGTHSWLAYVYAPGPNPNGLMCYTGLNLDWPLQRTLINIGPYSSNPSLYPGDTNAVLELGPCDSTSPWDTLTHAWSGQNGTAYGTFRAFRPVFTPYTMLPLLAGLSGLAGPIGSYTIHHAPQYPAGAIPGVTPPTHHVTIMRARAARTYTDPGHIAANDAFTTAADQWKALDEEARQAWTAAGKTCKPPIPGYALWTQIIKTKRLDRIPTLQTRTGISLTPPTV